MKKILTFLALFGGLSLFGGELTLVRDGKAESVIVTADKPSPAADHAAKELADHLKKITGAEIPVVRESAFTGGAVPVYVGATRAAEKAGLGQEKFEKEAWSIRSTKDALYITGGENELELLPEAKEKYTRQEGIAMFNTNGFNRLARRGTLYGVCAFLDRVCGVRWLWPGELGTVVPEQSTLAIADDLSLDGAPAFLYREWWIRHFFRWWEKAPDPEVAQLDFSPEVKKAYLEAVRRFLLIWQEGDSEPQPAPASHIFTWHREPGGREHPEWFAMRDDGERKPYAGDRGLIRLCVSNPGLHQFVVDKKWDGGAWIGLGEADARGFCRCPVCMSWDAPQPEGHHSYSTTNRYIRYAREVWALAQKKNPDVKVAILMYMDYIHPPTGNPDLSWMYGKFVPWGSGYPSYYPMAEKDLQNIREAWLGWHKTGIRMGYRPNYLLSGYTLPALDIEQTGEMFRFFAQNGMTAFGFDSLRGMWSTKGPMLYMHMRLGADPSRKIDDILAEYYAAFGPASEKIRQYFDYWIRYTLEKIPPGTGGVDFLHASEAVKLYPLTVFEEPERILSEALLLAEQSPDKRHAERVKFIQHGLQHAKLCTEFSAFFTGNKFTQAREKLHEILSFRRAHEKEFFCDLTGTMLTERDGYRNLGDFMRGRYRYFSDPALTARDFKRDSVQEIKGLKPGKYGLVLPENEREGNVVFEYKAGEDNAFVSAELTFFAKKGKITNRLELSFDNQEYRLLASDIEETKIPLTDLVKGRDRFFLRFSAARSADAEPEKNMILIKFRLDYEKQNPEKQLQRPKLEIGEGWIDPETRWYFRKDPENRGLTDAEKSVSTFPAEGWTELPVPARLESTPVGPYLGYGWYSAVLDIRKDWDGRDLDVLVGAVDEQAWVYFNGEYAGEHSVESEKVGIGVLWNEPFIIHIPASRIRFGEKNLLQIRIHASRGSSGIWQPVKIRPVNASAR